MTAGLCLLAIVIGILLIGLGIWYYGPNGPEANYDDTPAHKEGNQ